MSGRGDDFPARTRADEIVGPAKPAVDASIGALLLPRDRRERGMGPDRPDLEIEENCAVILALPVAFDQLLEEAAHGLRRRQALDRPIAMDLQARRVMQ